MTIKQFSSYLGFNSHSFFIDIFNGKKFLSNTSIEQIAEKLKLKARERKYLMLALHYDKSSSTKEKQQILQALLALRLKVTSSAMSVNEIEYYKSWYNPIVRELVVLSHWNGDFGILAEMVTPTIKEKEAEQSVKLLCDLELIKKENGVYSYTNRDIYATEELRVPALYWVKEMIAKGINAIDMFTTKERCITTMTASMSQEKYLLVQEHFEKINALICEPEECEDKKVYQVGLQMFPVSKEINKES